MYKNIEKLKNKKPIGIAKEEQSLLRDLPV
jgi:hypothetical protein